MGVAKKLRVARKSCGSTLAAKGSMLCMDMNDQTRKTNKTNILSRQSDKTKKTNARAGQYNDICLMGW